MNNVNEVAILGFVLVFPNLSYSWWPFSETTISTTTEPYIDICQISHHRCKSGECISKVSVCDGIADCSDKSDETVNSCKNGSTSCHTFSYYCKYGACVGDRTKRPIRCDRIVDCVDGSDEEDCESRRFEEYPVLKQDGLDPTVETTPKVSTKRCILPSHPLKGYFQRVPQQLYISNSSVKSSVIITLACNDGYKPAHNSNIVCIDGEWLGGAYTGDLCIKLCPPLNDSSYMATCTLGKVEVDCSEAIEGTTAKTKCSTYYRQDYNRPWMTCMNGIWSPPVGICYPECGKKRVNINPIIIGGQQAIEGEYPWIIAIYNMNNTHICGGSLISRKHVLSAAHCFTDISGNPLDKNDFSLVAGKYYRLYDDNRDAEIKQMRKILKFHIHQYYRGYESHFLHDIIVVEVSKLFKLSLSVQPVCIDWSNMYEGQDFVDGKEGVVGGWGFTTDSDTPAQALKKLIIPYRNSEVCKKHLNKDYYERYFTFDKICAGYLQNESNVCSGDSGSGYYFRTSNIYYIRGIVSSVQSTPVAICDQNNYAIYTKISVYLSWLEDVTGKYL